MDLSIPAQQNFHAGIIFLSYVIAVVGAFTTLELLQRRTHIRGLYNWFLLFAAAASMGGVGIWSMHFIGNNSLTITLANGEQHQLSYATGYTFASLIVAIVTMFLAFAFVGITEDARVRRIVPSGVIAGFGIVSMHYLGQVAIDFFTMKNKLSFVISASVIAVCAVTVALFIFFKLREKWANQWYKRLGCAMLMGVAVCGMHYTALAGTVYYPGNSDSGPPTPLLGTSALIGIIAAVVVSACVLLFFIGAKNQLENKSSIFQKNKSQRRLILDTIFFDTNGRILVKVDGVVPMKEIWNDTLGDEVHETFTTSHPLFIKLFDTTMQWSTNSKSTTKNAAEAGDEEQVFSHSERFSAIEKAFLAAAKELVVELRFTALSDLGYLFDSVLQTNVISGKNVFTKDSRRKSAISRSASTKSSSRFLSTTSLNQKDSVNSLNEYTLPKISRKKDHIDKNVSVSRSSSTKSYPENATVIDIFTNSTDITLAANSKLSVRDSDTEDRHIFLVKKIESNKDLVNLLSIGFRFAEPAFISKTMGDKLRVPAEYMLNYFKDMLLMTETSTKMYTPIKRSADNFYSSPAQQKQIQNDSVRGGVFVGLFTLIEDQKDGDMPYLVVQKDKRYTFPLVPLLMDGDTEAEKNPTELSRAEKNTILRLSGKTLANVAAISKLKNDGKSSNSTVAHEEFSRDTNFHDGKLIHSSDNEEEARLYNYESETSIIRYTDKSSQQFTQALENAAKHLIRTTSYGKPLATSARLYGDVIDIPAFSLRPGPCQLILFRAHITTPGTRFAINSTLTESIKCIPFPMYRAFAYYITDHAIDRYRIHNNQGISPSNFLTQQRLYQNTAARKTITNDLLSSDNGMSTDTVENNVGSSSTKDPESTTFSSDVPPPEMPQQVQPFSSLSPPPRVKRNKFAFTNGISSIDITGIRKEFLPNMLKGGMIPPSSPGLSVVEMPVMLNLLPASDRFWWLNNMFEETHNT